MFDFFTKRKRKKLEEEAALLRKEEQNVRQRIEKIDLSLDQVKAANTGGENPLYRRELMRKEYALYDARSALHKRAKEIEEKLSVIDETLAALDKKAS